MGEMAADNSGDRVILTCAFTGWTKGGVGYGRPYPL